MKIISSSEIKEDFYKYYKNEEHTDTVEIIGDILLEIERNGDKAIRYYTNKFDSIDITDVIVGNSEIQNAYTEIDDDVIDAIKYASNNIKLFAEKQKEQFKDFEFEIKSGVFTGQKVFPIENIGVYVPAGRFPLPSSVLMGVIPAKVAGCKNIVLCSPPKYNGTIHPAILVAADIAGVHNIYKIGGVQAIAAMTYGTESVLKVDKIVGPGNKYVAAAKKQVYGTVGIDFIAGPTEILIIADDTANPAYIAADILAQAEHDIDAEAILLTNSVTIAKDVLKEINKQIEKLSTKEIAKQSIDKNGLIIIESDIDTIINICNKKAPEHLELQVKNANYFIDNLKNYGTLFIGNLSVEALGDYSSGLNHTLPTNSSSRYTGGLSVKDFLKIQTTLRVTGEQINPDIANAAYIIADTEGLNAHANSIKIRR